MNRLFAISTLVVAGIASRSFAGAVFQGLGYFPGGDPPMSRAWEVSGDGTVVVGDARDETGQVAFRWSANEGMTSLPAALARSVSADGAVIVGNGAPGIGAFRWTEGEGIVDLGHLPGGTSNAAEGVSGNGRVVVGSDQVDLGRAAFRWTQEEGIRPLGMGPGYPYYTVAYAASFDGSVIVGEMTPPGEAFRWTASEGFGCLGHLSSQNSESIAWDVSYDGTVVIGWDGTHGEAFRWTAEDQMVSLGFLPGGLYSKAYGVSADGSVVVGWCWVKDLGGFAFIWDAANGMRSLEDVLANDCGLDIAGWRLQCAYDVSADGRTIVGVGDGPYGSEAWIATIPEPATLSLLALGGLAVLRRRAKAVI